MNRVFVECYGFCHQLLAPVNAIASAPAHGYVTCLRWHARHVQGPARTPHRLPSLCGGSVVRALSRRRQHSAHTHARVVHAPARPHAATRGL